MIFHEDETLDSNKEEEMNSPVRDIATIPKTTTNEEEQVGIPQEITNLRKPNEKKPNHKEPKQEEPNKEDPDWGSSTSRG